jgi:outer membrane protein
MAQQEIRRDFSRNQRLPELNLSGSYGFNTLGESSSDALSDAMDSEFVSWSVGIQLRVPLGGNGRGQAEYRAAKLRLQQEETSKQATEVAIMNQLSSSVRRVENNLAQARNHQRVAELNASLLQTELARLDAGQSDSRRVLDIEERLTEALEAEAASMTRFMVGLLELDLASGTLLSNRGMEPMLVEMAQVGGEQE